MSETTGAHRGLVVIARGGASAHAPGNTIAAFELAVDQGADLIQLPVHLSKDEHPVVIEDCALDRVTDGRGQVRQHSVRELKRLDAGGWMHPRFRGQRLQTLQEVLERFRDRVGFCLDLRGSPEAYPGLDERALSALEIYEVAERSLIQARDPAVLERLRSMNSEVQLGLTVAEPPIDRALAGRGVAQVICAKLELLSKQSAAGIRQSGLQCYAWTVIEPAMVDRLIAWDVAGLITDRPGLVKARLGR